MRCVARRARLHRDRARGTGTQSSAAGVCQLIIDRAARLDLERISGGLLKVALPTIQKLLNDQGVPLDLSHYGASVPETARRKALELPLAIARQRHRKVVFFIDELQRAADYADGVSLVRDLVDIYAGNTEVVVLVDGSDVRTIEQLLGNPYELARLGQRRELPPTIPADQWRRPLLERFEQAGLSISAERLEQIIHFGEGRPYDTMSACLYVGIAARRVRPEDAEVDDFVLATGLKEARDRLGHDD